MVKAHLRRRASDGHDIAGPIGIRRQQLGLRRRVDLTTLRCARLITHAIAHQRQADLHGIDAPHQLIIQLEFSIDAQTTAAFGPDLGLAEEVCGR